MLERGGLDRGLALAEWEDGGSAVLQTGSSRAGPSPRIKGRLHLPGYSQQPDPRMSAPRTINTSTKQP